jgi:hypothetical protein
VSLVNLSRSFSSINCVFHLLDIGQLAKLTAVGNLQGIYFAMAT